jgi:hypothetical protein
MATHPARAALREALDDWRRHALALTGVVLAFGIAALFDSDGAYYGAALVTFTIWMVWFVLTAVEWIRLADF